MKHICLILLLVAVAVGSYAQKLTVDEQSGKYTASEVVSVEGLTKDQLFAKTKEWLALTYNSANDVIQLADADAGRIIGKGNFSCSMYMKQGWIRHTLVLDFKDGRYRYTYSGFSYYSTGSGDLVFEGSVAGKKKLLAQAEEKIQGAIFNLNAHLSGKKKQDEW